MNATGPIGLRASVVAVASLLLVLIGALPALADTTRSWDVTIDVGTDGSFVVEERITQNFTQSRHGIYRYIPVTENIAAGGLVAVPDGDVEDWFQRIKLEKIRVTSTTAPDEVEITRPSRHDSSGVVSIRVGDPDTTITGNHEYVVRYRVEGALLAEGDQTLLRWDVVGNGWEQLIDRVSITVTGAGIDPSGAVCVGGINVASPGCTIATGGDTFRAKTGTVPPYTPVTINIPFDDALTPASTPILQRRFTVLGALYGDARAFPLAILTAALMALGLGRFLYREGRDRVARADRTVDGRTDTTHDQVSHERIRRFFDKPVTPIEYRPPDDLRPGQLGLILDERVDPVDVSASIVDLAVRGYLQIEEEVSKTLWWSRTDWTLRELIQDRQGLHNWEVQLLKGLFDGRDEVQVGDLKGTFAEHYAKVETGLYEDARLRKWFAERPDKVRSLWLGLGIFFLLVSVGGLGLSLYFSRMALALVPVVLGALVLLAAHNHLPRRTAKGSALLSRTLGFRQFIEAAEGDRAQYAERENLFIEYLPYAVVFGATEKWAKAFADLGLLTAATGVGTWYVSHHGGGFDAQNFSQGMSDFSTTLGTAVVTSPPSSSSDGGGGDSGGGFGGGGGGSW